MIAGIGQHAGKAATMLRMMRGNATWGACPGGSSPARAAAHLRYRAKKELGNSTLVVVAHAHHCRLQVSRLLADDVALGRTVCLALDDVDDGRRVAVLQDRVGGQGGSPAGQGGSRRSAQH